MPYIRYNPHEPGDREIAYMEWFLGLIFLWGSVGSIIYYICSLVSLFKGNWSENIFYSIGLLFAMSIVDFFILYAKKDKESKKESAKKYYLLCCGSAVDLAGIVAIIVSINLLCHTGSGTLLLTCSIICVMFVTIIVVILYRRIEGCGARQLRLFTDKTLAAEIDKLASTNAARTSNDGIVQAAADTDDIYCHKCGKKLPNDSVFCNACGTRLK